MMTNQTPTMIVEFRDEGLKIQFKQPDRISPGMLGRVQIAARKKLREYKGKAFNVVRKEMGPQAHLLRKSEPMPINEEGEEPKMTDDELIATLTEK